MTTQYKRRAAEYCTPDMIVGNDDKNFNVCEEARSSNALPGQAAVHISPTTRIQSTAGFVHEGQSNENPFLVKMALSAFASKDDNGSEHIEAQISPRAKGRPSSGSLHSTLQPTTLATPNILTPSKSSSISQQQPSTPAVNTENGSDPDAIQDDPATGVKPKRERWLDSSCISGKKPRQVRRDSNGRFIPKDSGLSPSNVGTPNVSTRVTPAGASPIISLEVEVAEADTLGKAFDDGLSQETSPTPHRNSTSIKEPSLSEKKFSVQDREEGGCSAELEKKVKKKRAPVKSPYFTPVASPSKKVKSKNDASTEIATENVPTTPKRGNGQKESPKRRSPGGTVSCIPFPPLSSPHFGLIQEKLAHDPFRLLIAVTFLIRTKGVDAIPIFYKLLTKYPTAESLVSANKEDIVPIIRHLGLQNQRAATYQTYAKLWLEDPPRKGRRYAVRGYPTKDSGRDIKKGEILPDDDKRDAWEIGHMTQGPYAIDSWRIFCRDVLRGKADGWNGEGNKEEVFQPEWMRVLPEDKELRAYLRWMWLKEGFEWDPFTGDKEVASKELMSAAIEGRIAWDDLGGMRIIDKVEGGGEDGIGEPLDHSAAIVHDGAKDSKELTGVEDMNWEI